MTTPTLYTAAINVLACWSRMHPRDRPMWLAREVDALSAALESDAANKQRAARANVGTARRPKSTLRPAIRSALAEGKTVAEIRDTIGGSAGLITAVRREMQAETTKGKP